MDPKMRVELAEEAMELPSIVVSSAAAGNAVMLGGGYFNPLTGYMNLADAMSCAEKMMTTKGVFFPVPILNMVKKEAARIKGVKRIALRDPNVVSQPVLAVMDVEDIEEVTADQMKFMTEKIYRTTDMEHPGVRAFNTVGNFVISGPIKVLNFSYFDLDFPETFRTAYQIREEIQKRGWEKGIKGDGSLYFSSILFVAPSALSFQKYYSSSPYLSRNPHHHTLYAFPFPPSSPLSL